MGNRAWRATPTTVGATLVVARLFPFSRLFSDWASIMGAHKGRPYSANPRSKRVKVRKA